MQEDGSQMKGTASSTKETDLSMGDSASSLFSNTGTMSDVEGLSVSFSNPCVVGTFNWVTMGDGSRLDRSLSR